MSNNKISREPNLALMEGMRRQKIEKILGEMKLDNRLNVILGDDEETGETMEEGFIYDENLRDSLIILFRMAACDLKEQLEADGMALELADLMQMKKKVLDLFIAEEESGELISEELIDWDAYMQSLLEEMRLFVYKNEASVKAVEKMALESIEGNLSEKESKALINSFRRETRAKIQMQVDMPKETQDELMNRLMFMGGDLYENIKEQLDNPDNFFVFLTEQIDRFAEESYDNEKDFLINIDGMKKKIMAKLKGRYGQVMQKHSQWLKGFFERKTKMRPGINQEALWEAVFEFWLNEKLSVMMKGGQKDMVN